MEHLISMKGLMNVVVYSFIGCIVFGISFKAFDWLSPGDFWYEINEDQNQALAIIFGAVAIGLSIIIAAAIRG